MIAKKIESTFFNMVLVILIVTVLSSASLAYVYNLTKDKIDASKKAKELAAIEEVIVKGFDNKPNEEMFVVKLEDGTDVEFFPAKKAGKVTSYAVKTYTNRGFNGLVELMVGVLPDGTINKLSVINQKETPGLGTAIELPKFKDQFNGKNPASFKLSVKKDGGNVDAVTAATISSRAVCHAVTRAYDAYLKNKGEE
jgi:electron transport complex protein RnfG